MKKIIYIYLALFLLLSLTVTQGVPKSTHSVHAVKVLIIPFLNRTGEPSLDWVSYGLQDAISNDITYLKGFDTVTFIDLPKEPPFIALSTLPQDELLKSAENEQFDHVWTGQYHGDSKEITLEISVVDVNSKKTLTTKQIAASLEGLLKETSMAVLEIAEELGSTVNKEAKTRVLNQKTASTEAWKLKTEGVLYLKKYLDTAKRPGEEDKEQILEKCEDALNKATVMDPSYAEAWDNLGWLYIVTQQGEESMTALNKSLEIKPYLINSLMTMGMISVFFDVPKALNYFKRGVDINPSLSMYHDNLYEILLYLGKKDEALKYTSYFLRHSSRAGKVKAIRFLMGIGNKEVMPLLIEVLNDPDKIVRGKALDGLWYIGDRTVVPHFIKAIQDPDDHVRQIVLQALGSAWTGDQRITSVLIEALKSPDPRTRQNAAWALGNIGATLAVSALLETLKDPVSAARGSAASALGVLGDKKAVHALMDLLKDPDIDVCRSAAKALQLIGDKRALPSLLKASKDPDVSIRRNAMRALAELADKTAVPFLLDTLNDPDKDVRKYAAMTLRKAGDKEILPKLIEAMKNPDETVRINIVSYLEKIGDPKAIPILIEALKDTSPMVRDLAVKAIGKIGGKEVIAHVLKALKDPHLWVRLSAIKTLSKIGDSSVVPALIEALKDPSEDVRGDAAKALGDIKDTIAIPSLVIALKDPEEDVRFDAALALAKLGNKEGVKILIGAMDSFTVREDAIQALIHLGEIPALYDYFQQTSNLFVFRQMRKLLLFSDRQSVLITSPDPFLKSSGHYLLALRAREEGKYKEQLQYVNDALKYIDPQDKTAFTILCLWLKAQAELKLNHLKDAVESVKKAEDLFNKFSISVKEKEGYEEPFEEYTLFLKGEVLSISGENRSAISVYEEALRKLERSKKDYDLKKTAEKLEVMVRTSLGALQIKIGKENLERAVEGGRNYQASDSVEMESEEKRYMELARQKIAEGNYEESQKLLEELNLRRTHYINRRMKINLADAEKQGQINEFRKKQEEIESIGKRIEALGKDKKGVGDPLQGEDEIKRLEKERNDKRRELQLYLTNLKKTHPDMAALLGAKPIELTAIQEQLPEDTAILQYLMLSDKLIVFVIKNKDIDIVETQAKRSELLNKVESLRKAIYAKVEGENSRMIKPLSRELYGMLIKPIEEGGKLKGVRVIGIAPNSFLHQLPFGALIDQEAKYLMDRYILFYMNSTSILGVAMAKGRQRVSGEKTLLAFSNPDGSLDYADREVADISELFAKKMIYSKKEAKKSVIQNKEKGYSILHLSTHGNFNPIDSTKSYLVMSDSNLTVEEIWGLPLKGTVLTVLSACETGIGEVLSGDDVVSLENAFIYAGSPSVVATLWKVADQSTAELMNLFYQNLIKGMTKAQALTEAMSRLRERYEHPFFWAAFTLRGDWR